MTHDEITAKAREVGKSINALCIDPTDPTAAEYRAECKARHEQCDCELALSSIASALRECAKEARDKALTEAAAVASKYGWSQSAGERVSSYGEGALDIADAIASMIRRPRTLASDIAKATQTEESGL